VNLEEQRISLIMELRREGIFDTRVLSAIERVRRFLVVSEPFTVDNHMMTPTLKIRRHKITERYGEALEALY